jgi:hypothetical protein
MPFESSKLLKVCPVCSKEVRNVGLHVANMHPNVLAQLDAGTGILEMPSKSSPPLNPVPASENKFLDISSLIKKKLETMLDLKILEMLSSNNSPSIVELHQALNPPKQTTIQELKEMHDLIFSQQASQGSLEKISEIDTGNNWANVALQALPIIKDMLPAKKAAVEQKQIKEGGSNVREGNTGRKGVLKPIQGEAPGDTGKPGSPSEKPGISSQTEQ